MKKGRIVEFELPNDFYLNKEEILVTEISLGKLNEIMDNITYLINEIRNLEQRIDKAVEYIEDNFIDYESAKAYITYDEMLEIPILDLRELLEILRGENEVNK